MKKITFFVIALLLLQVLSSQLILVWMQQRHLQDVWCRTAASALVEIKCTEATRVNDHEVRFQNKLFDVVKKIGDVLYCVADSEEDQMLLTLNNTLDTDNGAQTYAKIKSSLPEFMIPAALKFYALIVGHLYHSLIAAASYPVLQYILVPPPELS